MTAPRALLAVALAAVAAGAGCSGGGSGGGRQGCTPTGGGCTSPASCCSGTCGPASTCVETCHEMYDSCTVSAQCCADLGCTGSNVVLGNFCWACSRENLSCTNDNDCCSGLDCRGSTCLAGTCSTQGQPCSGNAECCAHLRCDAGSCRCGTIGETCGTTEDCCGGQVCAGDHRCHPQDAADGARCLADGDCALGNCVGATSLPGTCCQDAGTSCAATGATCCGGSVCRGPDAGPLTCGACLPLLSTTTCHRTEECCSGNLCEQGRCCEPIGPSCSSADQCCNGRCAFFEPQIGVTPALHCCGGPGASCRTDATSTCCDGFHCMGSAALPWGQGTCLARPGSECRSDADCEYRTSGSVCIPRDGAQGAPTVCSAWLDQLCSDQVPCPAPLVCDPVDHQCFIPPGGSCSSGSCVSGTTCDLGVCCSHPGATCGGSTECCTGTCGEGGTCACGGPGVHCTDPSDCCAGDECNWIPGTNDSRCCALERSACQTAADCCFAPSGRLCDAVERVCCRPAGSSCTRDQALAGLPCCDGTTCREDRSGGYISYVCK